VQTLTDIPTEHSISVTFQEGDTQIDANQYQFELSNEDASTGYRRASANHKLSLYMTAPVRHCLACPRRKGQLKARVGIHSILRQNLHESRREGTTWLKAIRVEEQVRLTQFSDPMAVYLYRPFPAAPKEEPNQVNRIKAEQVSVARACPSNCLAVHQPGGGAPPTSAQRRDAIGNKLRSHFD
jgi:hypothetical protein